MLPPYSWDKDAAIPFDIYILGTATSAVVTGKPAPATPISAKTYVQHGGYSFEIWREEHSRKKHAKEVGILALLGHWQI